MRFFEKGKNESVKEVKAFVATGGQNGEKLRIEQTRRSKGPLPSTKRTTSGTERKKEETSYAIKT